MTRKKSTRDNPSRSTPIDRFQADIDARKQHEVDTALSEARRQAQQYQRRYDDLLADYNGFREECGWLDLLSGAFSRARPVEPKSKTGTGEAAAVAVGCDWHGLEVVDPAQVNQLNEYGPEICKASVREFFHAILAWTNIHRHGIKIRHLVLALLGDLITNMLHDDQKEGNAGTPQEEILFVLELICGGLDYLLEHGGFDRITVACCDGNHGRDTERIRAAGRCKHSHEWLLYQFLARMYAGRVEFAVADGYLLYLPIMGKVVRFHHGDGIRYQGGIGGLTIPMNKAIRAWNIGRRADLDVCGHWHQTIPPGPFYAVGSLIGYAPYSIKIKADYEEPQQGFFLMDGKRGLTAINHIKVRPAG